MIPELNMKECEACNEGIFKSSIGDTPCSESCGSNALSYKGSKSHAHCYCLEDYYFASNYCNICPKGAICKGGFIESLKEEILINGHYPSIIKNEMHIAPYSLKEYYVYKVREKLINTDDWLFLQCPVKNACLGNNTCIESMEGFLCSECKSGYSQDFHNTKPCTACVTLWINLLCVIGWYLLQLVFNTFMAYINVAAGYNRKSIHSIVIKIAVNFYASISILFAIDILSQIALPKTISQFSTGLSNPILNTSSSSSSSSHSNINNNFDFFLNQGSHYTSMDCLIGAYLPHLNHGERYFYAMVFYFFLPITVPLLGTLAMILILYIVTKSRAKQIQMKLDLLKQLKEHQFQSLYEQMLNEYSNERAFLIFRYLPLPNDTLWIRFLKLLEDMIPLYVTILFFYHSSTTRHMLTLLNCQTIDLGLTNTPIKRLNLALNINCLITSNTYYLKFFILGLVGFIIWGIGIPLTAFIVLFRNRHKLNEEDMRLKYGFLHNGYQSYAWFWESIVFTRKLAILILSGVSVLRINNQSISVIWAALCIALLFL
ncbi:kringle domain-containing protein, partial [Cardiosporidium cionae]